MPTHTLKDVDELDKKPTTDKPKSMEETILGQKMLTSFYIHIPMNGGPTIADSTVERDMVRRATLDDMYRGICDIKSQLESMRNGTIITGMIAGAQRQAQAEANKNKIINPYGKA